MSSKVNFAKLSENLQQAIDNEEFTETWILAISILEFIIKKTNTKVDDVIFLPLLEILKKRFNVKK